LMVQIANGFDRSSQIYRDLKLHKQSDIIIKVKEGKGLG
jgi:hypothetical protein